MRDVRLLHLAVEAPEYEIVKLLLEAGADASIHDKNGLTALYLAIQRNCSPKTLRLLLDATISNTLYNEEIGKRALHLTIQEELGEHVVKALVALGVHPFAQDMNGLERLGSVILGEDDALLEKLLELGMDALLQDNSECRLKKGQDEIVEVLLRAGLAEAIRRWGTCTPLHHAIEKSLNRARSDVSWNSTDGTTPIHLAVSIYRRPEILGVLLDAGLRASSQNNHGNTPLHLAVSDFHGKPEIVKMLLDRGADTSIRNNDGDLPLHLAITNSYYYGTRIVEMLLRAGSDISAPTFSGQTPLMLVAQRDTHNTDMLNLLLERGAKLSGKDNQGWTTMHWAAFRLQGKASALQLFKADIVWK